MNKSIRILSARDMPVYRDIRLRGLREDSTAFGSSYEEELEYPDQKFLDRIAPSGVEGHALFGSFEGEELVGVIGIAQLGKAKMRHTADIWGMYVKAEHRGRGIGRALLDEAIRFGAALDGVRRIRLAVNAKNEPARQLYRSRGFECYGNEPNALFIDGEYYNEELYVLSLSA
ncbi:MAG: GNAT family N-acetyltransferase [Candidatus Omnitrophica bacterium]|nr:GNAT family N-acetyltransferase [Candidatus Omnitrophota bacterium]